MQITIPGRWIIVGLFAIIEAALLVSFHYQDDHNRATTVFGATIVGGAFALYTYLQGIEERRAKYAQDLLERWNRAEMLPVRAVLREITENRINPSELMRTANGSPTDAVDAKRACVVAVLNFSEEVAIAARTKAANEHRLYDFFDAIVRQAYAKLEDWIKNERRIDNEPQYYCEVEALYRKWIGRSAAH